MANFKRHRTPDEIKTLAAQKGYTVDTTQYDRGSDYITVTMPGPQGTPIPVLYSGVSGRFFHAPRTPGGYFSSDETKHDGQPWFEAMLAFFLVA